MINDIILRSVFGKVGQKYFIQPCPNPRTGRFAECVKPINANGDMILSESDKEDQKKGLIHFIPMNELFLIEDGFRLDLTDVVDKCIWEAIQYSDIIAKDRSERDDNGDLIIDGNQKKYGTAELYVERPGELTKARVTKKQLIFKAQQYIYEDSESNRIKKCQVLGRDLRKAYPADVLDYMISISEKEPQKIINMYEDDDWKMHLFILEAIERGVIRRSEGIYRYDDKMLGGSIEATITLLRDVRYKAILDSIKRETYPEYLPQSDIDEMVSKQSEGIPHFDEEKPKDEIKTISKKKN